MSITSCYRYVLELPTATLNAFLVAVMSEPDTAGLPLPANYPNEPIGSWTATVTVRAADVEANPPTLELPPADLSVLVKMQAVVETTIDQIPELEPIVHNVSFDLDGIFEKTAETPPRLVIAFPALTGPGLNLVITGGDITLTPELIEPRIHELYDADPTLGHEVTPGVPWPLPGDDTVTVITDIYDDEPSDPGYRGEITVDVPDATHVNIHMPGHFQVLSLSTTYIDTDMTVDVLVTVEFNDGEIRFKLSDVQAADVTVTFAESTIYDVGAKPILADQIALKIRGFGDQVEAIPTDAEVEGLVTERLLAMASAMQIPVLTPGTPSGGDVIDLTTFVPMTVNQQVLALGLEPLEDGTPCDAPDVFAKADGFSISVVASKVNEYLNSLEAAVNGSTRNFEGHDITVNNVNATLSDAGQNGQAEGHIWITGTATAEVDCWADPEVDFWGPIDLVPELEPDGTIKVRAAAGAFGADDPCCADVDPADIAAVVEAEEQEVATMPTDFTSVGELAMTLTEVDISSAGIVIHGTMEVITLSSLQSGETRQTLFWYSDRVGGG